MVERAAASAEVGLPGPDAGDIRVLTYNVRSLRDDRDGVTAVLRDCRPDVVCVQEAPRFLRWRSKCAALARGSGLVVVTGGRTAAGTLLLGGLRTRVVHTEDVLLPRTPGLHRRGMALALLDVAGARVAVGSVHLGLPRAERAKHLPVLLAHLARVADGHDAGVHVLAGDVNEPAGGPTWGHLRGAGFVDAYGERPWGGRHTFPSAAPRRRIDGVFVRGEGVHVRRCGVPELAGLPRASDHLPVLADVGRTPLPHA